MADHTGQQFGNYRLVRLLGQGGYAGVYLGQHLRLNQQAAIKVLHAHLTESEAEHFQQEAQTISTLVHPSIIRVFDYDVQDGVPFLVMDYAPNGSLRQRYPKGSVVPLLQIVSYVKQVADALQYAHEQKFIHRDVKPENMLLGWRDEVLLSDFGIATIAHSSGSISTHEAIGTLTYMAPEQIEGHPRPASDQYSLGCAVYEWLCGSRPFEGSPTEVMVQQLSMPPRPLRERIPDIPSEVEQTVLKVLAKDPKARFASVRDFELALEDASQFAFAPPIRPAPASPDAFVIISPPAGGLAPTVETPSEGVALVETPQTPSDGIVLAMPLAATRPVPLGIAPPLEPTLPVRARRKGMARRTAVLLIGLAVLVVAGGVLGSLGLLAHFGLPGVRTNNPAIGPVRGGTWTVACVCNIDSLIPNGSYLIQAAEIDQALYLPLFYGDAQGMIHAGAATMIPTVQNGGISADARTWTFHLRPGLVWSDGQPYDARDVDYSWKLWLNPAFGTAFPTGLSYVPLAVLQLISSAVVWPDRLSITFHLKRPYVPFLQFWVDGIAAPLPAHHFSNMTPGQMAKSPDNLKPQVVSGAFLMADSVSGNHFTLVRNPHYYLAGQGLPYLDKVVFRDVSSSDVLKDLQANALVSTADALLNAEQLQDYKRLRNYTLATPTTNASFEALWFNFHNVVLANHREVRQAIADAIDYQALIQGVPLEASEQCTDHSSFFHPGYDPADPCPIYDPTTANQLLDSNGWVRGPDGVRTKAGQRLEFEYTLPIIPGDTTRFSIETIVQRDLQVIGIKLDIQNIPEEAFFNGAIQVTEASPPTGALPGRNDILEIAYNPSYDPDDSLMFACDQFPPNGGNLFYCNHALDALYQEELTTLDPGARQNIFAQIHLIYLKDFPMVVLFGTKEIYLVHTGTHNFQPSPVGAYAADNIWEWWCDRGKC